ncbi:hypothetical protein BDZ94DRAFT_1270450 [Collybia nuda]|uniref:Uncharacterized protein n=1 Tax=Collybia nuda TaxID=64659 RepID=A0A9P5XZF3_9AGAR|nr:hypothetical protein BDZ94DRAFT_1270450 [Collybia nuda]
MSSILHGGMGVVAVVVVVVVVAVGGSRGPVMVYPNPIQIQIRVRVMMDKGRGIKGPQRRTKQRMGLREVRRNRRRNEKENRRQDRRKRRKKGATPQLPNSTPHNNISHLPLHRLPCLLNLHRKDQIQIAVPHFGEEKRKSYNIAFVDEGVQGGK